MMIKTDYHMHSTYSPDGHNQIMDLCQYAVNTGLEEIAITDHVEWIGKWQGMERVEEYRRSLHEARTYFASKGLRVFSGVEIGNPHQNLRKVNQFLQEHPFDLTLGSIHWLYGKNIHLEEVFGNQDPNQVFEDYFLEIGRMALESYVDIIAHFDRILWRSQQMGIKFDLVRLEPAVRQMFVDVLNSRKLLELNTHKLRDEPNWHDELVTMLCWFREEGGDHVVVNSDAHHDFQIADNYDVAEDLLEKAGINQAIKFSDYRVAAWISY